MSEITTNKKNLSLITKYKSEIFIEIMFLSSIAINNYGLFFVPNFLNHVLSFRDTFL